MTNLQDKKLLILGGNPETRVLVEIANSLGIYTIVVDPNPSSPPPARRHHAIAYDIHKSIPVSKTTPSTSTIINRV